MKITRRSFNKLFQSECRYCAECDNVISKKQQKQFGNNIYHDKCGSQDNTLSEGTMGLYEAEDYGKLIIK